MSATGAPSAEAPPPFRLVRFVVLFIVLFVGYRAAAGMAVDRFVIETLTVRPAAAWLGLALPAANVRASGDRIDAEGGGVRVLPGCEGFDALLLLVAAFSAVPLAPRVRWTGIAMGVALVFVLNQARIAWLFFAWRHDPQWFALSHGLFAPLALVATLAAWFWWFTRRARAF